MTDLQKEVKGIVDDIVKLYNGLDISDDERNEMESNGEATDLYSYFDDVMDIEYHIGGKGDYRGVELLVCFGGPNVWVDTVKEMVIGCNWGERVEFPLSSEICNQIDMIFEDCYNCVNQ